MPLAIRSGRFAGSAPHAGGGPDFFVTVFTFSATVARTGYYPDRAPVALNVNAFSTRVGQIQPLVEAAAVQGVACLEVLKVLACLGVLGLGALHHLPVRDRLPDVAAFFAQEGQGA